VRLDFEKEQVMSSTHFVEALSVDTYVRALSRRAVRVLNDPTLDRQQREIHIRRLQSLLVEHEVKEAAKAKKLAEKKEKRERVARGNRRVADQSQVLARRKEFCQAWRDISYPVAAIRTAAVIGINELRLPTGNRPVLTLKKA